MSDNFQDRFDALASEAQAAKNETVAEVRRLLSDADTMLDLLRVKGIAVRTELPMGANIRLSEMRFISEFSRKLK